MIPADFITEWRSQAPWTANEQIEQDLTISRVLVEIFSDPFLQSQLAFRGGTALYKLFVKPAPRYSEDIDLVQTQEGNFGAIVDVLKAKLSFLGAPKYERKTNNNTLSFRFESEIQPIMPMKLKIETNTREHFNFLGLQKVLFEVKSRWFSGKCEITTFRLEELLATKIRALYQRRKGRDLFDLHYITQQTKVDIPLVIECYRSYMAASVEHPPTAKEFLQNVELKIKDDNFRNDVYALLSPLNAYNSDDAFQWVKKNILASL